MFQCSRCALEILMIQSHRNANHSTDYLPATKIENFILFLYDIPDITMQKPPHPLFVRRFTRSCSRSDQINNCESLP